MEYLDLEKLNIHDTPAICLMNYMNDYKYKATINEIRFDLEIGRDISPLDFIRKAKDYELYCDLMNVEFENIFDVTLKFPFVLFCENKKRESIFISVYGFSDEGIITKDEFLEEKLISKATLRSIYKGKIIFIKENSGFLDKFPYKKEADKAKIFLTIGISLDISVYVIFQIISRTNLDRNDSSSSKADTISFIILVSIMVFLLALGSIFLTIYKKKVNKLKEKTNIEKLGLKELDQINKKKY